MTITSLFNVQDKVLFRNEDGRYQVGKVVDICSWNDRHGFLYDIVSRDGHNHLRSEDEIYISKEKVLENVFTKCEYDMETNW